MDDVIDWDALEAFAVVRVGIPRADFWRLTPRQLDAYLKQFKAAERARNNRAALVAWASIAAIAGDDAPGPDKFVRMLEPTERSTAERTKHQTPDEMKRTMHTIFLALGGKDLRKKDGQ